jgi:hypothetical protein
MKIVSIVAVGLIVGLAGCQSQTVNADTVGGYPNGMLCEFLGPGWISTPEERIAIYTELEKRQVECLQSARIVVEQR